MSGFTPAQERHLRAIIRDELRAHAGEGVDLGAEGANTIVHTPLGGVPRKIKGVRPTSPSLLQDRA